MLSEKLADWRFLIQQLSDEQLAVTRRRSDWRLLFGRRMRGRGVEIGALFKPIPVSPDTRVRYVDRRSREALYDELEPVDIVNLLTWFAQHVHPIDIEAGPVTAFFEPEFHVLFRVRESTMDASEARNLRTATLSTPGAS